MLVQQRNQACAPWAATEAAKSIEHWQIRFSRPIVLNALSTSDPEDGVRGSGVSILQLWTLDFGLRTLRDVGQKGIDEARLADARLASDKHDLPLTTLGFVQPTVQLCEFRISSYQKRCWVLDARG